VDYALRRRLLEEASNATVQEAMQRQDEGLPKLWLLRRALDARKRRPDWLGGSADYRPLDVRGAKGNHIFAFVRAEGAAVIVPRFPLTVAGDWQDTCVDLPPGRWFNELSGESREGGCAMVGELLHRFPVALLTKA
jgi:(1->4)-alpha-D-glucan 1-alpha-D-glucosylmutase